MGKALEKAVDFGELVNTSGSQRMLSHKVVMYLAVAARSENESELQSLIEKIQKAYSTLNKNTQDIAVGLAAMSASDGSESPVSGEYNLELAHPTIIEFERRGAKLIDRLVEGSTLSHVELGSLADLVAGPLAKSFNGIKREFYARYRHDRDQQAQEMNESMEFLNRTLSNVESISSRIKMISLNAAVEAARLGQNGAAFAVIATAVRNLSIETEHAVTSMRETLSVHRKSER